MPPREAGPQTYRTGRTCPSSRFLATVEIISQAHSFPLERRHAGENRLPVADAAGAVDGLACGCECERTDHLAGASHAVGEPGDLGEVVGGHRLPESGRVVLARSPEGCKNLAHHRRVATAIRREERL